MCCKHICVAHSTMCQLNCGAENSNCLIVDTYPLKPGPKGRFGDNCLCNEESLDILTNVFIRDIYNNYQNVGINVMGWIVPVCYNQIIFLMEHKCICQPTLIIR